jgi:predicted signal transduction protein with EAL and GGDEF domain
VPEDSDAFQSLIQFLYQTPVGLIDADADGRIHMMNPMAAQLLMPLARHAVLDNLFDVLQEAVPQVRRLAARPAGPRGVLCEGLRFEGGGPTAAAHPARQRTLALSLFSVDGKRLTAVVHDATQDERRQRRRVDAAAQTDRLTGLANRQALHAYLAARLEQGAWQARPVALLFINADRFQHVNDTVGQTAGDAVLAQLAGRLQALVDAAPMESAETVPAPLEMAITRRSLVARIGGDEFALAFEPEPGAGAAAARAMANEVLRVLDQPYTLDGEALRCPASIGIAHASERSQTAGDLLYHARLAMVAAKRAGGNRAMEFAHALQEQAQHRSATENDLRRAVQADELFVVYQPVVSLRTGRIEAVEALVRWQHPVRGLVSPVDFIGIAEETGLIVDVGAFVLREACRQFMRWQRQHGARAPGLMAVNLSRGQLPHPSLVDDVAALLAETGMRPAQLQLEVTESMAAQDAAVQMRLRELKRLGLTLALDDFGTGYSSLASLHQLPIDVLKIDRSFVSQLETSPHHRVLVEATVRVAQSLSLRTVAEGIETEAQAAMLAAMQCDKGQGYHFAQPLRVAAFDAWLGAHP